MPRGTRYTLIGTLRWTRLGYALEMGDGGVWQLDVGRKAHRYLDERVTIEGIRSGFDLLDVLRISPVDTTTVSDSIWHRFLRIGL